MRFRKCFLVILGLALVALPAAAQIDTGAIVGTVSDTSGASVPKALVTAMHVGTNLKVSAHTNDLGQYVFNGLRIGSYQITAELAGFRKTVQTGVQLHVQERLEVNLTLQVGEITQQVEITDAPPLLHTQSADMGHVVDTRQVVDLPLNGRRYADLALLSSGVLPRPGTGNPSEARFNVNGNFSLQNNFILDGISNNHVVQGGLMAGSPQVVSVTPDALAEFKVQTRTYSAEFGEAQGAVINATIKSGTNRFRGTVYHFHRNAVLDANDFFANRAGLKKGQFIQNQGGFNVGGPVRLGPLYDGTDRTFFFFNYGFLRIREASTLTGTVPTPAMKRGDFSGLAALTDPGNAISSQQGCIVNNVVQPRCIDPVGQAYANLYPDPTVAGPFRGNNFVANQSTPTNQKNFDVKIDQKITERDKLFGRYSYFFPEAVVERGPFDNPLATGGFSGRQSAKSQQAMLGWTRLFSAAMINEARFGFGRKRAGIDPLPPPGSAADQVGLRGVPKTPFASGLPTVRPGGFTFLGTSEWRPQYQVAQVWQALDDLSYVRGTHSFKFGFDWKRYTNNQLDIRAMEGTMSFANNRYVGQQTFAGVANLLLGNVTTFGLTTPHVNHIYLDGWAFYGQDTWRVRPNFTLLYGLRWEYFTPPLDRRNQTSNFDFGNDGQIVTARDGSVFDRALVRPDRNNFSPRLGFSYNPWRRVTVRGGFGVYYQAYDRIGSGSVLQINPPHVVDITRNVLSDADPPIFRLRDGYPAVSFAVNLRDPALLRSIQTRAQNQNSRSPYVEQWSLGTEFEIARNLVFEVAGVGNYAHKVRKLRNLNQGIITGPRTVLFPYQGNFGTAHIEYLDSNGDTNFHSLQMRVEKRYAGGLSLLGSYTWGKALGNVSDPLSAGESGGFQTTPQNAYNTRLDYGPLPFDQRHRLVVGYIYELPFGRGKRWLDSGPAGYILGNWQINGMTTLNSGPAITASGPNNSGTGPGTTARANCVKKPSFINGGTIDRWFDTSAFESTLGGSAPFSFGTCGPGTLVGPGTHNWDFSVFKKFPMTEGRWVQFHSEFFNLWNHAQFRSPNTVANNAAFGQISATRTKARQIQFALKLYF